MFDFNFKLLFLVWALIGAITIALISIPLSYLVFKGYLTLKVVGIFFGGFIAGILACGLFINGAG